jgi:hypothetical protein
MVTPRLLRFREKSLKPPKVSIYRSDRVNRDSLLNCLKIARFIKNDLAGRLAGG